MAFTDDTDAARPPLVVSQEEIAFDPAAVAVAESEEARAVEESVLPVNILAGFAGDNLDLTVATVEEILLNDGGGIAHRLPTVADAHRFAAVAPERGARPEVVVVDEVMIRRFTDFDLQGRRFAGFSGQVTMVHSVFAPGQVNEEFVRAVGNGAFGEPTMVAGEQYAVGGLSSITHGEPTDDNVVAFDSERGSAAQNGLAGRLGTQCDRFFCGALGREQDDLVFPGAVCQDHGIPRPHLPSQLCDGPGRI